jgi:N-acetyl-1-D-myo-inositol-2-amino-2-deoxy-alpha-D-glucopyranoside deacetylase
MSNTPDAVRQRVLLVHAHPDDESITTGVTMAAYAARGALVTLITCTRGEQGEVIPPDLAHLAADRDDTLGSYREGELAEAMRALGVRDHRFLDAGTPRHYRESGMTFDDTGTIVLPDDARPDAFARVPVETAAADLAAVLVEVRPHILITYDPGGGYGHPDHVQTHRVAMRAVELAVGLPQGWAVPTVYWIVLPESVAADQAHRLAGPGNPYLPTPPGPSPSMVVPDDAVTTAVDGTPCLAVKAAALRAHATQVLVSEPYFALSNRIGQWIAPVEYFRRAPPSPPPPSPPPPPHDHGLSGSTPI